MFVPPSYFSLACEPQTCFRSSLLSLRKITSANRSGKTIPWCKTFCFDVGQSDQRIEYSSSDSSRPRSWILTRVTKYALEGKFHDYKGAFTWHRGDFRAGASSLRFPLMALYLFTWYHHKISCRHESPGREFTPVVVPGREFHSGTKSRNGIM